MARKSKNKPVLKVKSSSKFKDIGLIFYKSADNMLNHDGVEHAGYLSFMTLLTFFPFLVFFAAIIGALGQTAAGNQFVHMLLDNAPQYAIEAILPRINEILSGPPQGLLTVSIFGAIWTSSSIVEGMRTVLNRAYHVKTPPTYFMRRTLSIGQILLLTVILVVVMVSLIIIPIIFNKIYGLVFSYQAFSQVSGATPGVASLPRINFFEVEWSFLRYFVAATVALFFVATIYYVLPNVKHKWRDTLPGAGITVIGWVAVAKGMVYYLINFSQFNVIYGSLTNIIIFLLFFYLINMIFIYGAEFNYLLEKYLGHKLPQKQIEATTRTENDKK